MTGTELAIYALAFLGVFVIVEGVYLLFFGKSITLYNRVSDRLDDLNKTHQHASTLAQLRKDLVDGHDRSPLPFRTVLTDMARRAGLGITARQIIMVMALLSAFLTLLIAMTAGTGWLPAFLLGALLGVALPLVWINAAEKRRLKQLEEQLPDAVDLMVRSLKVGHPISASIAIVASEIPEPLATEFALISDEAAYGRDISDALMALADRLNLNDLRFLAVAISIQQQSGGNLSEILDGLSKVIRARFRLFRRVKTITAEAKWSGMFLTLFPVVGFLGIMVFKPDYYAQVQADGYYGWGVLIVCAFMLVNLIAMRIIVNVKV